MPKQSVLCLQQVPLFNIAFANELSKIFDKWGIDTGDVWETAGTKWNFLPFRPSLVGALYRLDPYYLV